MLQPRQLSLLGETMPGAELTPDPGVDHGEVFTRRWVVEFILDLVGFTADKDLGAQTLVEPSCGTGAFLLPIVERLVASSAAHSRDLRTLGSAISAFDLLDANARLARKAVAQLLIEHGLDDEEAGTLVRGWVTTGDFLLYPHDRASVDYVIGNPPYVRLENVEQQTMDDYRKVCPTMRGRANIYVGFIERGLDLLKPGGTLSFICADRWMRNQYGADLRSLITSDYAVDTVVSMHDVDAFEHDVSAYPAIIVLRNERERQTAVVEANAKFSEPHAPRLASWVRGNNRTTLAAPSYEATCVNGWFGGRDLWPTGSPSQLALIADLESRFPPLQDEATGTRVGIGVATGCDDVFITTNPDLVEPDRQLPLLRSADTTSGSVTWSGRYLVDPWESSGLVDLGRYPRLAAYLHENEDRLRARHIAKLRPATWYRTIDRIDHRLTGRPKLLMPDLKAAAHPVLDDGSYYPHHNLYYVTSDLWDPEVLGGLLLSDITNLFVGAYCVRMRGGTYRFQAQYLRRIRVPDPASIDPLIKHDLAAAFVTRDRTKATAAATKAYGLRDAPDLGRSTVMS